MIILNRFCILNWFRYKRRTMLILIAIILSSTLLFSVGIAFSTYRDNGIREEIYHHGSYHAIMQAKTKHQSIFKSYSNLSYDFGSMVGSFQEMHKFSFGIFNVSDSIFFDFLLLDGRYPVNEYEIIVASNFYNRGEYHLLDSIDFLGKTYTIVGVYEHNPFSDFFSQSYFSDYPLSIGFSKMESISYDEDSLFYFLKFDFPSDALDTLHEIAFSLGYDFYLCEHTPCFQELYVSYSLLSYYGASDELSVYIQQLFLILSLTLFSFVSFFIIYNVMNVNMVQKRKHYGVLFSLGASRKQVFGSVYFEAFVFSLFSIPIGFLLGFGIVQLVLMILNTYTMDLFTVPLSISIYWPYILMSFVFLFMTVILATLFPASRASEISPIRAVLQNKDIQIGRRGGISKWFSKLFGIEGILAFYNLQRDRKKYRVTIFSILISIALFTVISTLVIITPSMFFSTYEVDDYHSISFQIQDSDFNKLKQVYEEIQVLDGVYSSYFTFSDFLLVEGISKDDVDLIGMKYQYFGLFGFFNPIFLFDGKELDMLFGMNNQLVIKLISFDDDIYQSIQNIINLSDSPILYVWNPRYLFYYGRGSYDISLYEMNDFDFRNPVYSLHLSQIYYDFLDYPFFSSDFLIPYLILNSNDYQKYHTNCSCMFTMDVVLQTDVGYFLQDKIYDIFDFYDIDVNEYQNPSLDVYKYQLSRLAFGIISYSVVLFTFLIAIISVISTIIAGSSIRVHEFSILKSIGMEQRQLYKMVLIEIILLCGRILIYAVIVVFSLIYIINWILCLTSKVENLLYSTWGMIFSIVFGVSTLFLTMILSTRAICKVNIVDGIKDKKIL